MKVLGTILIIAGILMFIFRGFNFTTEKEIADIGPLELKKQEEHKVYWPMYAGGILVIAGIAAIAFDRQKK